VRDDAELVTLVVKGRGLEHDFIESAEPHRPAG
jgi:hypothetical protein